MSSWRCVGEDVYEYMKFESGVHRVQRVPVNDSKIQVPNSTTTSLCVSVCLSTAASRPCHAIIVISDGYPIPILPLNRQIPYTMLCVSCTVLYCTVMSCTCRPARPPW